MHAHHAHTRCEQGMKLQMFANTGVRLAPTLTLKLLPSGFQKLYIHVHAQSKNTYDFLKFHWQGFISRSCLTWRQFEGDIYRD